MWGAALALPRYIYYAALHSFTKHRFLCNLTSGSNAYIPSNTSIQQVAGTARPPGHGPEGPVADDRKNDLPASPCSPAAPDPQRTGGSRTNCHVPHWSDA